MEWYWHSTNRSVAFSHENPGCQSGLGPALRPAEGCALRPKPLDEPGGGPGPGGRPAWGAVSRAPESRTQPTLVEAEGVVAAGAE
jgi:hypothetical protein